MDRIGILLMALLLSGSVAGIKQDVPTNIAPMDYACTVLEVDCTEFKQPSIIYTNVMEALGLWGAYAYGEDFVLIDHDAPAATVVHEVTHYVLWNVGMRDRCISEEAARRVHHKWEGTPYDDSWRNLYQC